MSIDQQEVQDTEIQGVLDSLCDAVNIPSDDDNTTEPEEQEQEVEE